MHLVSGACDGGGGGGGGGDDDDDSNINNNDDKNAATNSRLTTLRRMRQATLCFSATFGVDLVAGASSWILERN